MTSRYEPPVARSCGASGVQVSRYLQLSTPDAATGAGQNRRCWNA
ncbi:hypothetical protein [Streptomyces malaysiensis]